MSDIEEMQGRILAAMERASRGLEKLGVAKEGGTDLSQALEDERLANAQLTERVKTLKDRLEAETAEVQAKLDAATAKLTAAEAKLTQESDSDTRMTKLDVELQQVRGANAKLSEACAALRKANEEGVGDPDLINAAMQAELDALRAARTAEIAEADAILSALTPLVESAQENA
jgi:predicted  nucleic acid-binding Zn-ribbon protein